jgi:hypothetical protein
VQKRRFRAGGVQILKLYQIFDIQFHPCSTCNSWRCAKVQNRALASTRRSCWTFKSAHLSAGPAFWSVSFPFKIHGPKKHSFRLSQTATLIQNLKNLIRFLIVLKGSTRAFRVRGVHTLKNDALAYAKRSFWSGARFDNAVIRPSSRCTASVI